MSFLRSVIADARSRKSGSGASGDLSTTGWSTFQSEGNVYGDEMISSEVRDQTGQAGKPETLLPGRESVRNSDMPDDIVSQAVNRDNRDFQGIVHHSEPGSPLPVPVNRSGMISGEESHSTMETANPLSQEPDTQVWQVPGAEIEINRQPAGMVAPGSEVNSFTARGRDVSFATPEMPGVKNAETDHGEIKPPIFAESVMDTPAKNNDDENDIRLIHERTGAGEPVIQRTVLSAMESSTPAKENSTPARGEVVKIEAVDNQRHSAVTEGSPETITTRNDVAQKMSAASHEDSRGNNPDLYVTSIVQPVSLSDAPGNLVQAEELTSTGFSPGVQPVSYREMAAGSHTPLNMEHNALAQPEEKNVIDIAGSSRAGSSNPGSQIEYSISHATPADSHITLEVERSAVSQSAVSEIFNIAGPSGAYASKPGSPENDNTGSAEPPENPEPLRSTPAQAFQGGLMPEARDLVYSAAAPANFAQKRFEDPKVQIGQIDIIIEAPARPVTKPAPAPASTEFASRYYLRRL